MLAKALANRMARVIRALLKTGESYRASPACEDGPGTGLARDGEAPGAVMAI